MKELSLMHHIFLQTDLCQKKEFERYVTALMQPTHVHVKAYTQKKKKKKRKKNREIDRGKLKIVAVTGSTFLFAKNALRGFLTGQTLCGGVNVAIVG